MNTITQNHLLSKENRWFLPLFTELTVTNLAHFAVLAVLSVYLIETMEFKAGAAAGVLLAMSIGLRFSRVVLAPFIDRIAPRRIIPLAIGISMIGYLGMTAASGTLPVAFCLLLIGTGYGINGMLVTTLASYSAQRSPSAFPMYLLMNIGTNIAAALSPALSNWLRLEVSAHAPFWFSAAALGVSLLISLRIRADIPATYNATRFHRAAWPLLKTPGFWGVLGIIALSWAVYTQKFAATPLFINTYLARPDYIGWAVTANALIVLAISFPAASFLRFYHIPWRRVLIAAFSLYALAYTIMAWRMDISGLWLALGLWSTGEALLMPQLNALVAEVTRAEDRLAGFSLSAIAIGAGEAAGNAFGVALMDHTLSTGNPWLCYALLALICIAAVAAFSFASLRRAKGVFA